MAASRELEKAVQLYRSLSDTWKGSETPPTVEDLRTTCERWMSQFRPSEDVSWDPVDAGGVPGEWIATPGAAEERIILYLHGGGYVFWEVRTYRDLISRLARAAGARGLGIDYRRAPEHPFPAALEDSTAAYRWLLANGASPSNIAIAGDSAGGGLALATLVALRDAGEPLPSCGICISPWVDLEALGKSMTTKAQVDPIVVKEVTLRMAKMYIGERDWRSPLAAPLYADLRGLPPLLIHVGGNETLLDDSTRIAQRAKEAGVEVTLEVWDDMPHVWHIFASFLPEARQAIDGAGEFIRKHVA